jgi:bifunctional N-acetylglucosamine-1-phosphate-uridyltransferase/glucosamine-1-phosphate-acetyltransferase GlmU-like protein
MQLLVLAAGNGSRFAQAGYRTPKPLLPLPDGRTMVEGVVEDCWNTFGKPTVTVAHRASDAAAFEGRGWHLASFPKTTRGATETALLALLSSETNLDDGLVIANADQRFSCRRVHLEEMAGSCAALTMAHNDGTSKWSYDTGEAIVEKPDRVEKEWRPTIGVYCFLNGWDFVYAASQQILEDDRHGPNQEYYLAPLLNRLPRAPSIDVDSFDGLGTPEDYESYCARNRRAR